MRDSPFEALLAHGTMLCLDVFAPDRFALLAKALLAILGVKKVVNLLYGFYSVQVCACVGAWVSGWQAWVPEH
jgi:hypothetical protein